MRRTLIAAGLTAVLALGAVAAPAEASYRDPLTRGDHVTYGNHDYRLSITPVAGAKKVVRLGHPVPSTYSVRMIDPRPSGDVVVYSGRLGWSRTAYLRIKTVSLDLHRDYGIRTYLKKVTGFSAAYAAKRVLAFTVAYRHRVLRADVATSASNVWGWIEDRDSTAGVVEAGVTQHSDGFFGYEDAKVDVLLDVHGTGKPDAFVVYGYDPTDGYSVLYDSADGRTRTTLSDDDRALLE